MTLTRSINLTFLYLDQLRLFVREAMVYFQRNAHKYICSYTLFYRWKMDTMFYGSKVDRKLLRQVLAKKHRIVDAPRHLHFRVISELRRAHQQIWRACNESFPECGN